MLNLSGLQIMDVLRLESARMEVNTENIMITLDIDWAPDWVIDEVASIHIEHKVKVTWFVTHATMAVERLRENSDLFELGLYTNWKQKGNAEELIQSFKVRL